MTALVAVLVTLSALTEHYLRSLSNHGHNTISLDWLVPSPKGSLLVCFRWCKTISAETTSQILSGPMTVSIFPHVPAGSMYETQSRPSDIHSHVEHVRPPAGTLVMTTGAAEQSETKETSIQVPPTSRNSLTSPSSGSIENTAAQTPKGWTTGFRPLGSQSFQNPNRSYTIQSHQPSAGIAGHQTLDKALSHSKAAPTSTWVCFECTLVSPPPASAVSVVPEAVTSVVRSATRTMEPSSGSRPGQSWVPTTVLVSQATPSSSAALRPNDADQRRQ